MSDKDNYIKDRLEEQQKWYERKASENKTKHHILQIVIIASGALIPIINSIPYSDIEVRIISSILGGIVIVITGMIQLKKYQENWIQYRTTEEILKKEKFLYLNSAGEYSNLDEEEKHQLLVERIESVISNQNVNFFVTHNEKTNHKNS